MFIKDKYVQILAKQEALYDGRPWLSMSKENRQRYYDRCYIALQSVVVEMERNNEGLREKENYKESEKSSSQY